MKVAILIGSVRKGRQSHKVANYLEKTLKVHWVETDLIDLSAEPLPVYGSAGADEPETLERIKNISGRLNKSDAMIFVTPEYHGSFSGALKNALDYFWSEFSKKPIGVVAVSAGKMGGINASTQLQHVILSLGAYPLPLKLLVPEVHNVFDDSYEPRDSKITRTSEKFLQEFIWFVDALVKAKSSKEKYLVS